MPNAANLVVGNDVRIGGSRVGSDQQDRAGPGQRRRQAQRGAPPQAGHLGRAAAHRHHVDGASAVGARPEVRGAHARHGVGRVRGRRHRAGHAGHARAGRDRRRAQHLRRPRTRRGSAAVAERLRHRPGRARQGSERGPDRVQAAAGRPRAGGRATWPTHAPSSRGCSPRWSATAAEVAPVAETQAALFGNLDTTFAALASVARALPAGVHLREPAHACASGIDEFPRQRPFLRNSAGFFRELRPGIATLPASAPQLADAFEIGQRHAAADAGGLNRQLAAACSTRSPSSPRTRGCRSASAVWARTAASLEADHRPPPPPTPPRPLVPRLSSTRNVASYETEGDADGTWQRFIISRHSPGGPNNEGSPSSAPSNRARRPQLLAREPVPEHRVAGPDQEGARPATRTTCSEPPGDRQRAGQPGHQERLGQPGVPAE